MSNERISLHGRQAEMAVAHKLHPEATHHIFTGPVGSGKSFLGLLSFKDFAMAEPRGSTFGIVAPTLAQVRQLLRDNAYNIFGVDPPSMNSTEWIVNGRIFLLRPGESSAAEGRIRGGNWSAALVDEATLCHPDTLGQVGARLRTGTVPKLYLLTNPGGPTHPIRLDYILSQDPGYHVVESEVLDNPSLKPSPQAYFESLRKKFHGPAFERMALGKWVSASGEIYDLGEIAPPPPEGYPLEVIVGVDDALAGEAFAAVFGKWEDCWYSIAEWKKDRHDRLEPAERAAQIVNTCLMPYNDVLTRISCDPTSQIEPVLRELGWPAHRANNAVLNGITITQQMLSDDKLVITSATPMLFEKMSRYSWDEKASLERGIDTPLKEGDNDHAPDATRYAVISEVTRRGADSVALRRARRV